MDSDDRLQHAVRKRTESLQEYSAAIARLLSVIFFLSPSRSASEHHILLAGLHRRGVCSYQLASVKTTHMLQASKVCGPDEFC